MKIERKGYKSAKTRPKSKDKPRQYAPPEKVVNSSFYDEDDPDLAIFKKVIFINILGITWCRIKQKKEQKSKNPDIAGSMFDEGNQQPNFIEREKNKVNCNDTKREKDRDKSKSVF